MAKNITGAVEISGKDSDDQKEEKFIGFTSGQIKRLIIKPKIGAFGLNWQHCNHVVYFPTHSYEQYYQAVRRCWRFGQEKPVTVDLIDSKRNEIVYLNMMRKAKDASSMFTEILSKMGQEIKIDYKSYEQNKIKTPGWLKG